MPMGLKPKKLISDMLNPVYRILGLAGFPCKDILLALRVIGIEMLPGVILPGEKISMKRL